MFKIVGVAITCAIIIIYLKSVNSELAIPALICSGVVILGFSVRYLEQTVAFFEEIKNITGLEDSLLLIIIKITAIGYIVEFAASTIEDFGLKSLSAKLVFIGKLIILSVSFPIIYSVINVITVLFQ